MLRTLPLAGAVMALMALAACGPPSRPLAAPGGEAQLISWLYLDAEGPARADMAFRFAAHEAVMAGVALQSLGRQRLPLSVACDGAARLRATPWGPEPAELGQWPGWAEPETPLHARLGPRARDRLVLDLAPEVTRCRLRVQTGRDAGYTVILERDEREEPGRAPGAARQQADASGTSAHDALAAAFLAERPLAMSAALPAGAMRLLPDATGALNARIEALTGAPVPRAVLETGDPMMPLDFTNAPALDAIYISYLYVSADFSGALMARMLAWHALRGTEVRILVADAVYGGRERAFFEGLAARYPRIQLQPFRFAPRLGDGAEARLARVHRANHAKLMVTLAHDPARSRAIVGGRNWHDSYFFLDPHDLSAFPVLRDYATLRGWSWLHFRPFEDIELEYAGPELVQATAAQFLDLWHRDHASGRLLDWPPGQAPAPVAGMGSGRDGMARHFLSLPWLDANAQIPLFVDLIDAAQESIDIATPFINLPPELEAAFARAIGRGVVVRVVSTVQREGLDGLYLNLVQRGFIRDWAEPMALYDLVEGELTLHSKIFVFDRRLTMITATNLNQRSFYHDIENGLIALDRRLAAQAIDVIEDYIRRARPVDVSEGGTPPGAAGRVLLRHSWLRRLL